MAFNKDLIRNKLEKLQNRGGGKKISDYLWKPEVGTHVVRIVENNDPRFPLDPFHELYFHYRFMNKNYLSPATFGDADPLIEFAEELSAQGDKEAWKQSRKFRGTLRTYVPVLVRGKEEEGVKWWGFGITIYNELMQLLSDEDWENMLDLKNGNDLKVTVTKDPNKDFADISVTPKPKASKAAPTKEIENKLNEIPSLVGDVYELATYDELDKALNRFMSSGGLDQDEASEKGSSSDSQSDETESEGSSGVDEKEELNEFINQFKNS